MNCQNCGKRDATVNWTDSALAFTHGLVARWCEVCALEAQIAHAEEVAALLPERKARLAELLAAEPAQ